MAKDEVQQGEQYSELWQDDSEPVSKYLTFV